MKLTRIYLTNRYHSFYELLVFPMININNGGYCDYYSIYIDAITHTIDGWDISRTHSHDMCTWMNKTQNIEKLVPLKEPNEATKNL